MNELKPIIIPLSLFTFVFIAVVIVMFLLYKYFDKRLLIKAVQNIIKDNKDLTAAQIQAIISSENNNTDAKKGFFAIGLTMAFVLFALIMGSNGYALAQSSLLGMSMFPLLLGLTYLYYYFFEDKSK